MSHPIFPVKTRATIQFILVTVAFLTGPAMPVDAASTAFGGDTTPARTSLDNDGKQTRVEENGDNSVTEQPLIMNIDAYGLPEGSKPLGPHSLRRSFATLAIDQLRDNAMSTEHGGLVLNLFSDVVVKADKSYVELRADNSYSWFGYSQDNPHDAVILTVVDGNLAGMVMREGELFHIKSLTSDYYEISQIDQSSFAIRKDDQEIAMPTPAKSSTIAKVVDDSTSSTTTGSYKRDIVPVEDDTRPYRIKKYMTFNEKYDDFFNAFATINIGALVAVDVAFGGNYPNHLTELQLAVDLTNMAFVASGVGIQLNLAATASTYYKGTGNLSTDLKNFRNTSDGFMDAIHATRDEWNWKADLLTLVVSGLNGECGRAFTLFHGSPKSDWSVNGFNVVGVNCMAQNFTLAHEVGHNLGATHDWHVEPVYNCPTGEVEDLNEECFTPEKAIWGPSSYGHGYIQHDLKRRSIMAYDDECKGRNYECPRWLQFSDPEFSDQNWSYLPFGIPKGQYNAADNRSVLNENRTRVENYR